MRTFPQLLVLAACAVAPTAALSAPTFAGARYAAAAAPRAIATADVNRDGQLDLVTAGRDGIDVLLNQDGKTFTAGYTSIRNGGAFDVAVGDLNRDAITDVVVAQADAHAVDIYIGRGDGTFASPRRIAIAGGNPRGLTLTDYDVNGTLDIIVTEYATGAWRVLYGDGAGAISRQDRFGSIANPQGVLAADFNRDGRPDVAIAGAGTNRVAIFYSAASGGRVQRNVTVGAAVNVLAAGDFNKDGWLDLAAASTANNRIYTLQGSAAGLALTATITSGSSPRGIVAVDVDQDGRLDLVTANRASNAINVHLGTSAGTFATARAVPAGSGSRGITAGDFDHDGRIDLATIDEFGSSTTVLENTTALVAPAFRFTRQTLDTAPGFSGPFGVKTGDFNRDGRMDAIVWSNVIDVRVTGRVKATISPAFVNDVTVADFNRDGALDFAASDLVEQQVRLFLNRGDGTFAEGPATALGARVIHLASADFNRDGRADIIYQDVEDGAPVGTFHMLLGRGDGTFTAAGGTTESMPFIQQMAIADIDRDGNLDVVGASGSPASFIVWYGKGDGTRSRLVTYDMPLGLADVALADVNEDGMIDVVSAYENLVYVRLGLPGGDLAPATEHVATLRDSGVFLFDIAVGDVNLDGHVDVVTNDVDILFGNGDGSFRFDARSGFDGSYQDPVVADYNGDGLPDMLFNDGGGLVVMLNERGGTNRAPTVSAGPDRTLDYLTTNGFGDDFTIDALGSDPDLHELRYEWRDSSGQVVSTEPFFAPTNLPAGKYTFTVRVAAGKPVQPKRSAAKLTPWRKTPPMPAPMKTIQ